MTYRNGDEEQKQKLSTQFESHTKQKEKVRSMKEDSKRLAKEPNSKYVCANFDLQQVLEPC